MVFCLHDGRSLADINVMHYLEMHYEKAIHYYIPRGSHSELEKVQNRNRHRHLLKGQNLSNY